MKELKHFQKGPRFLRHPVEVLNKKMYSELPGTTLDEKRKRNEYADRMDKNKTSLKQKGKSTKEVSYGLKQET